MQQSIILASSSPFRQELLAKLKIKFHSHSPDIDETRLQGETARALVERLAMQKAKALADIYPNHLIIGSDQVCCIDDQILGKPLSKERAIEQLKLASNKKARFLTGLAVLNSSTNQWQISVEHFDVLFRELSEHLIRRYVEVEEPIYCAGSFKAEGSGIVLFKSLTGEDPNTLIGLPLIRLVEFLESFGVEMLNM
ncbi:Maf family protein [Celerinatantimonas diazotrophica]|uniref:7-methyl-GTP pyrophosphatase n=1 Tax=Celerinatantimonas diazotrophica TaxID=412034 RepID=A0A4V2PNM2_9GAMM|nr:nucleoside triphosphate pyrophosphatase [Celerinatantimonas diazotrophica]TCK47631.1 MAF protein [Celerinatantimonas diazotrophica]CAG9296746.1 7-methyl-GTP pyrophosphatase [Celerinatantimonas diazotrophica]